MGNSASTVPYGAHIELLNVPLNCSVDSQLYDIFNTTLSTTAPLVGGSGQQIYFSDFTTHISLPPQYKSRIGEYGSDHYNASVVVALDIGNAAPSTFTVSSTVAKTWSDTVLDAPGSDVASVGPFTLGSPGLSSLGLQTINITLNYLRPDESVVSTTHAVSRYHTDEGTC